MSILNPALYISQVYRGIKIIVAVIALISGIILTGLAIYFEQWFGIPFGVLYMLLSVMVFGEASYVLGQMRKEVSKLHLENNKLHETNAKLSMNVNELEKSNKEYNKQNTRLKSQIKQLEELQAQENDQLEAIQAENARLNQLRVEENEQLTRIQEENVRLNQLRIEESAQLESITAENTSLKDSVSKLRQLHQDSVKLLRNLATAGDTFTKFGETIGDAANSLQDTKDDLEGTVSILNNLVTKIEGEKFDVFDADGDGKITAEEFHAGIRALKK